MARGVRKTPLEKLQAELLEVQATIVQYENCLKTMKEKEKSIQEQIELEEFKEFKSMLGDQGMTMDDIKELVSSQNDIQQSA
ncbi:hypothetical protein [Enterocloster bolteae]|jgi:hypothetical protein|uniref:DUF4315 family protein n=2 Tax=Enterocloster bolteae TaxID=208479 RepID=A0A414AZU7_9FIRM|nr:hypothetical protein [Enterocloster bolteae]ENZ38185.1 hypothetical protein HMPREF1097_02771 [Enterocloster bolteae 90B8]RGO74414.1 hypothetical protein DXB04_30980 [Enterocloster bolteae]RHC58030.1 hypothetical protein DW839_04540 [Enterocloster bolteae]